VNRILIINLLAMFLLVNVSPASADEGRVIAVPGSATVNAAPDRATLSLGVEARNRELSAARDEVAGTIGRFLSLSDSEGIERSDVRTSGLNIRPEYRWNKDEERQELIGYYVQRDVAVELKDLDKLGAMMEGAVDLGINQVRPPVFSHSNEKELRRRALAAATEDARRNARQIAETLGANLGSVRRVAVIAESAPPMPLPRMAAMAASDQFESAAETYSTGQIAIEARVSAEFDVLTEKDGS